MEQTGEQQLQPNDWQSIAPTEDLPKDVETWMKELPEGQFFFTLNYRPGDDMHGSRKAYALSSEIQGEVDKGEMWLQDGFRTLDVVYIPKDMKDEQGIEIGLENSEVHFEANLVRTDSESNSPLKPNGYWVRFPETIDEKGEARDVMVRPDMNELKRIQMRLIYEGGDLQ